MGLYVTEEWMELAMMRCSEGGQPPSRFSARGLELRTKTRMRPGEDDECAARDSIATGGREYEVVETRGRE